MNLFIVGSPFQLLSAISAKNYFQSTHNTLIIRYSSSSQNNGQLKRLLGLVHWDKIIEIKKSSFNTFRFLWLIRSYSRQGICYKNLFIGDYRVPENLLAITNINNHQKYLLDDGGVTITVQTVFFNNLDKFKEDYLSKFSFLRKLLYTIYGLEMYRVKIINLFTCFNLTPLNDQKIISNDFSDLRNKLNLKSCTSNNKVVYFLGTSMVENGFISLDYYHKMMNKISSYYKNLDKKVLYIPHRIESESKLGSLLNENLELLRFENPVELEFIYRKINPLNVASFFSTALYTLKIIYTTVNIDAFLIDNNEISLKHLEHVSACYNFNSKFVNEILF
jgi:alpha-2,8-polysialyltransferase (POLYST)